MFLLKLSNAMRGEKM